jgi:hypothetical protein
MTRLATLLLFAAASTLSAQHSPFAGAWQVSYVAGMRMQNGMASPVNATAVLTIEIQGDSLIGNLVTDPAPDRPARPPVRLAARGDASPIVFVSQGRATVQANGEQREVTVVSTWKLAVAGDSLTGTVERRLEGVNVPDQGAQPVSGKRRQS